MLKKEISTRNLLCGKRNATFYTEKRNLLCGKRKLHVTFYAEKGT